MKLNFTIENQDIEKLNKLIEDNKNKLFYQKRYEKNIEKKGIISSKEDIWKSIIICLLTSQQNSSPESHISRFIRQQNFPLTYKKCGIERNLAEFISAELKAFGGIRFYDRIAEQLNFNLNYLENTHWKIFEEINSELNQNFPDSKTQIEAERKCARKIQEKLAGFGPKQSRNLLQILGLTVYEIPIDSRITKWLNSKLDFPIKVSATTLQDKNFYDFISDAVQLLCEEANIKPCLFDACVFSDGEQGEWTLENLIF